MNSNLKPQTEQERVSDLLGKPPYSRLKTIYDILIEQFKQHADFTKATLGLRERVVSFFRGEKMEVIAEGNRTRLLQAIEKLKEIVVKEKGPLDADIFIDHQGIDINPGGVMRNDKKSITIGLSPTAVDVATALEPVVLIINVSNQYDIGMRSFELGGVPVVVDQQSMRVDQRAHNQLLTERRIFREMAESSGRDKQNLDGDGI